MGVWLDALWIIETGVPTITGNNIVTNAIVKNFGDAWIIFFLAIDLMPYLR